MFGEQTNGSCGGSGGSGGGGSVLNGSSAVGSSSTVSAGPPAPKQPEQVALKARADRQETEDFYLTVGGLFERVY